VTLEARPAPQVPSAKLTPSVYRDGYHMLGRNLHHEDVANTVHLLAADFVQFSNDSPDVARDEVLHCNYPHFDPPEHIAHTGPTLRRLQEASIEGIGLQLYVNYSGVPIDPLLPARYEEGTFFIALPDYGNQQTTPPVAPLEFSGVTISATYAALGEFSYVDASSSNPNYVPAEPIRALYVTAGMEFDPDTIDFGRLDVIKGDITSDRFYLEEGGAWVDRSDLVPAAVRAKNNTGVGFLDINGDGFMDLYVGCHGDGYSGGMDSLLVFDPASGAFVEENLRIIGPFAGATSDLEVADLDLDGDLDIVVVCRTRRDGDEHGRAQLRPAQHRQRSAAQALAGQR
jgi:hypothetical protein